MDTADFQALRLLLTVLVGFSIWALWTRYIGHVTIYEFQKGMLYRNGVFTRLLGAGKHSYLKKFSTIHVIDSRKTWMTLPGQDILTKDNVNLKFTIAGFYEITDPVLFRHGSESSPAELYNLAQFALRSLVSHVTIDELLEKKNDIDAQLLAMVAEQAKKLGITVSMLGVRDIMLPPNLKKAFSGVLEAQKEAQRQLEKARGEQAVLRSLANTAALYENHPALLNARLIQAMSSGGNSLVFNANDTMGVKEVAKK